MIRLSSVLSAFIFPLTIWGQINTLDLSLSSDYVTDIALQENGLFWVGTDEGLNVFYDNEKHVFFSRIEDSLSLLNSKINKLYNTSDQQLVVLSQDGLSVYDSDAFNFRQIRMASPPVSVVEDSDNGTFWVATENAGYYLMDKDFRVTGHFSFDPLNPLSISTSNLEANDANSILLSDSDFTFIATKNGFNVFNNKQNTFKRYFKGKKTLLTSNNIIGILSFGQSLLLVSENEVVRYDIANKSFQLLHSSRDKILAVNSVGGKNFIYTKTKRFQIDQDESGQQIKALPGKYTHHKSQIIQTRHQTFLWQTETNSIAETNSNLDRLREIAIKEGSINNIKNFEETLYFATSHGVKTMRNGDNLIKDLAISSPSEFFYTYKNRLVNFQKKSLSIYNSIDKNRPVFKKNFKTDFSEFVFEAAGPMIFLAKDNLAVFDLNTQKMTTNLLDKNQLGEITINKLKMIENILYVSHDNGVIEVELNDSYTQNFNLTFYEYNELLNKNIPRGFYDIEKVDSLLFVTNSQSGLSLYKNNFNEFEHSFTYNGDAKKSLAASTPTKLAFNQEENMLYIATLGSGLFSYALSDEEFTNFSSQNGLLSNNIYDFLSIDDKLFFQSGTGINYLDGDLIKNITQADGLNANTFHNESLHVFGDRILISGQESLQSFVLDSLGRSNDPFYLSLFKSTGIDELNNKQEIPVEQGNIKINYKTKTIVLDVLTNQRYKAQQIQYFIERDGSTEVIRNGFNNQIQLNALPFYTSNISIFGINGDGQKSSNDLHLVIYNSPPWWLRVESIISYLLLLIVGIRFFVKYREQKTKQRMEGERKNQELEEAKQLQNSLLPKKNPTVNGFDISTYLKPATEIGGDYYDFFHKKGEYFYAICGDATGHGVVSGIMVSVTKAGLNGIPMDEPSRILAQLNRIVKRVNFGRLRMSLSVAKFNENTFKISSAAMPPTYYFSSQSNEVEEILVPNLPLGGIETEEFDGVEKEFQSGDVMVMISDGLPELPNHSNDLLDYDKVYDCIKEHAGQSAEEIKEALVDLSDQWADGLMNPDDITIVVIKKAA